MAKKKKRKYNPNRARIKHSYTLAEMAELYNIHKRTAQSWRKQGLSVVDNTFKPYLVLGAEIRRFLKEKRRKQKHPLKNDEFFCPKCKRPRKSVSDRLSIEITNRKLGKHCKQAFIKGICEICGQTLFRFSSDRQIQRLSIGKMLLLEHKTLLIGSGDSSLNTDIERGENNENKY